MDGIKKDFNSLIASGSGLLNLICLLGWWGVALEDLQFWWLMVGIVQNQILTLSGLAAVMKSQFSEERLLLDLKEGFKSWTEHIRF